MSTYNKPTVPDKDFFFLSLLQFPEIPAYRNEYQIISCIAYEDYLLISLHHCYLRILVLLIIIFNQGLVFYGLVLTADFKIGTKGSTYYYIILYVYTYTDEFDFIFSSLFQNTYEKLKYILFMLLYYVQKSDNKTVLIFIIILGGNIME